MNRSRPLGGNEVFRVSVLVHSLSIGLFLDMVTNYVGAKNTASYLPNMCLCRKNWLCIVFANSTFAFFHIDHLNCVKTQS